MIKRYILFCSQVFVHGGCVYIMANELNTVLYIGVSPDIADRVWKHKVHFYPKSFTAKYNCEKLVYYCFYPRIEEALAVERALKSGNRKAKLRLINSINPDWIDLYDKLARD